MISRKYYLNLWARKRENGYHCDSLTKSLRLCHRAREKRQWFRTVAWMRREKRGVHTWRMRQKNFPDIFIRLVFDMKIIETWKHFTVLTMHHEDSHISRNNATASCKQKLTFCFYLENHFLKMCTVRACAWSTTCTFFPTHMI